MNNEEKAQDIVGEVKDLLILAIKNLPDGRGADDYTFLDGKPVSNFEFKRTIISRLERINEKQKVDSELLHR